MFSYKRKYPFSNRTELLAFLKDNPILVEDPELELAYKNVDKDLEVPTKFLLSFFNLSASVSFVSVSSSV